MLNFDLVDHYEEWRIKICINAVRVGLEFSGELVLYKSIWVDKWVGLSWLLFPPILCF